MNAHLHARFFAGLASEAPVERTAPPWCRGMSRGILLPFTAAALALVWWGWHNLDAAQLRLGSRLC
ncbi:hypothetical protein C1H69_03805 [Billgrantia endophytica]|uniref:Uncharacterized protein n=2 Tax=Billgrantia endophytica TaxID=2033802 RepID=A0A2N7U9M9_9GAMM|nr:hypothetical protein C1H69_03805 [Halomonas endophytica]